MPDDFRDFCTEQIERLSGAFPEMRFYKPGAINELVNWLEYKSAGDRAAAIRLVTEVTDFTAIPSISDLNAVWMRLFPPVIREASIDCPYCNGSGWVLVTRRGNDGADRCTCGVPPASDPSRAARIQPRLSLAEIEQLREENHKFAAQLSSEMANKLGKRKPVQVPTEAEIDRIKAEQSAHRKASVEVAE